MLLFTLTIAPYRREMLAISPMLEEGVCQLLQADGPLNDDLELGGRITLLLVPGSTNWDEIQSNCWRMRDLTAEE